jgi:NAD(P)-dependent dehydrogenase (short-subunit alcohol dehydrogenase family)
LKETGITVNALHPGVVRTNFAGEFKGIFGLLNTMFRPFLLSPKKGSATSVFLASSGEVKNITGRYFEKCKAVLPKNEFINPVNQKLLWEKSMQFSGLNV